MPYKNPLTPEQKFRRAEKARERRVKNKLDYKNVAPENVTPKSVTPKSVTPKNVAPENVAPENVAPENVAPKNVAPKKVIPEEMTPKEMTPRNKSNLIVLSQFQQQIKEEKMPEPIILKNVKSDLVQNKKDLLDIIFTDSSLLALSFLVLGVSTLLGYFEFVAYRSLGLGVYLSLAATCLLQLSLLASELCYLSLPKLSRNNKLESFKKLYLLAFSVGIGYYGLNIMDHSIQTKKQSEISQINNSSEWRVEKTRLEKIESKLNTSYTSAIKKGDYGNAKNEIKPLLLKAQSNLEKHRQNKPNTTQKLKGLVEQKAQALFYLRLILLLASFGFLHVMVKRVGEVTC